LNRISRKIKKIRINILYGLLDKLNKHTIIDYSLDRYEDYFSDYYMEEPDYRNDNDNRNDYD
jgi:hypothetical protein